MKYVSAVAALAFAACALAQGSYPNKAVTTVVGFEPGGGTDTTARIIAPALGELLGQQVVVENRAGAGGNIGTEMIARGKPDGYTVGMGNFAPLSVNATLFKNLRFDPQKDLAPICLIEKGPLVLMVAPGSPFKSVKDVIAAAKAKPGFLTFASGGIGGSHQLSAELFKSISRIYITHIPYKGGAPAAVDLMGGQVDMMFEQMYAAAPSIRAGKLRALAITSGRRAATLPEVPTTAEAGYPKVISDNWYGMVGPPGLPPATLRRIHAAAVAALTSKEVGEQYGKVGGEPMSSSPEEFAAYLAQDQAKWGRVVKAIGFKAE